MNIEDTVHSEGGRLRSAGEHAEVVGELRAAADATGVHVVVSARTDLLLRQDGEATDRVDRAVVRLTEAAQAGADVLYPVGRHDPDTLRRLVVPASGAGAAWNNGGSDGQRPRRILGIGGNSVTGTPAAFLADLLPHGHPARAVGVNLP